MKILKEAYSRQLVAWRPHAALLPSGMTVATKTLSDTDDCILLAEVFGGSPTYSTVYLDIRDSYVNAAIQTTEVINAAINR